MEAMPTKNTRARREQVFIRLYKKAFPIVARYVAKMGGSFDEAKDIFHDALIIYYEKALTADAEIKGSEQAYLLGIAKHLWIKRHHQNEGNIPLDGLDLDPEDNNDATSFASAKLMNYLETAGQKCMQLLRSFYYDKLPLTQVSELFGYSGVRSVTVQKYKCLEKVRNTIKEKSLSYADFLE